MRRQLHGQPFGVFQRRLETLHYYGDSSPKWWVNFGAGIAAAFLTQLYMASGEKRWLDLAQAYQAFSMTSDACQFQSMQVCKSGWGAGLLYVVTREARYRDWTVRLGDWFLEHQFQDGHWENTKYWVPNPTAARRGGSGNLLRDLMLFMK